MIRTHLLVFAPAALIPSLSVVWQHRGATAEIPSAGFAALHLAEVPAFSFERKRRPA
jgi:hypothetical protein